jgi:hypothetical protein
VSRLFGENGASDGGANAECATVGAATVDLRPVRDLLLAGDRAGAGARVPQQVADAFVAHGDATACLRRVAEYRSAGVDLPVLFPMPIGGDWGYEEAIAAFGPSKEAVPSAKNS